MTILTYKDSWMAPGYRDLTLVLANPATGREYELRLSPKAVQALIFECAGVAKQIGDGPPIDWDVYPAPIFWPTITPWKLGPAPLPTTATGSTQCVKTG
jgi:hypothetical protein